MLVAAKESDSASLLDVARSGFIASKPDEALAVIGAERECSAFTPWRQGFAPKEHQEQIDRERAQRTDHRWRWINAGLVVITTAAAVTGTLIAATFLD